MPAQRSRTGRQAAPPRGRLHGLILVAVLLGLVVWSIAALQPPASKRADVPADEFSAARAVGYVQQIAVQPHVAGSAADRQVVEGLVAALSGLGLDTRVQNSVGAREDDSGSTDMARVRNVVAVLPGIDPTGRLFLVTHHDSVQNGPGGSDDAAGVATLLEAVRALAAGPQLRNDVVVVLTDAGEACLCGAEAFADSHPLAATGGVVLDVEARGTRGPPVMYETSRGNAGLAAAFAEAAPHAVASSAAVEVSRALPDDTDLSVLLADGDFTGLSSAFIDDAAAHHTPQDRPERLDQSSLQALGDNTLAVARNLGSRDLAPLSTAGSEDATFFPVLGRLVHYPGSAVRPLAGAALLGVVVLALVQRRRGLSTLHRTAAATALAVLPLGAAPLAARGLWSLLGLIRPGYAAMLDPWRPGWYRLATVALVAAVVLIWFALLRRRIGAAPLAAGGLIWLAVLAAVLAAVAPGGSYLVAWPALAGALAGILAALVDHRAVRAVAALGAGAVAVVVLSPTVALFFPALGLRTTEAPAFVATLLMMALLPAVDLLFDDPPERMPWPAAAAVPGAVALLAAACVAVGLSVDRFDAAHPVPSQLAYALDRDGGQAWWASTEEEPGEYTGRYVQVRGKLPVGFPYLAGRDVATAPAEVADLPAPAITQVSDAVVGGKREIAVRVTPQRPGVRLLVLDLSVDGGTVTRARVEGRAVGDGALGEDHLRITFHAPPANGLQAAFTVDGTGPVDLRVIDGSDGLAGLPGYQPRPDGVDAAGTPSSDLVLVSATTSLGQVRR